ncbi:fructosamine kinase [Sesbania bispinosa]|nr:fructosamine kinase [Sesbania bispinosa]
MDSLSPFPPIQSPIVKNPPPMTHVFVPKSAFLVAFVIYPHPCSRSDQQERRTLKQIEELRSSQAVRHRRPSRYQEAPRRPHNVVVVVPLVVPGRPFSSLWWCRTASILVNRCSSSM